MTQLQQSAIDRVRHLSTERLLQVIDYIDFLLARSEAPQMPGQRAPGATVEDLLAVAGIWQFERGELQEILHDVEQSRLVDGLRTENWL